MQGHFLDTLDTIAPGLGFKPFGLCHCAWLLAAAAVFLVGALLYRRAGDTGRRRARVLVASLLLADELFKLTLLLVGGRFGTWYLPLHLCSINIFLIFAHAVRPGRLKEELLYAVCLPAAVAALVFPGWSALPFFNFMHLHSFTTHILLALYPVLLLAGGELRPEARRLGHCALILLAACAVIYPLNKPLKANFFFLYEPGEGNPLVWFYERLGSPGYILGFPVIAAAVWLVLYAPFWLTARARSKKQEDDT